MFQKGNKVIGIVGGMGPQAGTALLDSITRNTVATADQQHLSVILMSYPSLVKDRTEFLCGNSDINPAYTIVEIIKKLECAGAEIIGIACNTSHVPGIYNVILKELGAAESLVDVVNMPFETCTYIKLNHPKAQRIGVMTTDGTYQSKLYQNLLYQSGYDVISPDHGFQHDVIHQLIYHPQYGIKANQGTITPKIRQVLKTAISYFRERRTDVIILGCTDLSFVVTAKAIDGISIVDSTDALALALISQSGGQNRK